MAGVLGGWLGSTVGSPQRAGGSLRSTPATRSHRSENRFNGGGSRAAEDRVLRTRERASVKPVHPERASAGVSKLLPPERFEAADQRSGGLRATQGTAYAQYTGATHPARMPTFRRVAARHPVPRPPTPTPGGGVGSVPTESLAGQVPPAREEVAARVPRRSIDAPFRSGPLGGAVSIGFQILVPAACGYSG